MQCFWDTAFWKLPISNIKSPLLNLRFHPQIVLERNCCVIFGKNDTSVLIAMLFALSGLMNDDVTIFILLAHIVLLPSSLQSDICLSLRNCLRNSWKYLVVKILRSTIKWMSILWFQWHNLVSVSLDQICLHQTHALVCEG